jgi:hypothetical protein
LPCFLLLQRSDVIISHQRREGKSLKERERARRGWRKLSRQRLQKRECVRCYKDIRLYNSTQRATVSSTIDLASLSSNSLSLSFHPSLSLLLPSFLTLSLSLSLSDYTQQQRPSFRQRLLSTQPVWSLRPLAYANKHKTKQHSSSSGAIARPPILFVNCCALASLVGVWTAPPPFPRLCHSSRSISWLYILEPCVIVSIFPSHSLSLLSISVCVII